MLFYLYISKVKFITMKLLLPKKVHCIALLILVFSVQQVISQTMLLNDQMVHLRNGDQPEWDSFSEPHQGELKIVFNAQQNDREMTLSLTQQDVRQNWLIRLNGKELGQLMTDENKLTGYWTLPSDLIKTGPNTLLIQPTDQTTDDILVGNISIIDRPLQQLLNQGKVEISVTDGQDGALLPSRISIVDSKGALQPVGATPDEHHIIRTGCIVTGNGKATIGLPEGAYTLYASRGFEYGVDSVKITVKPEGSISKKLVISREVLTEGWVASDTHIHTNYYAGDGDATLRERAVTLAGEGIELPVLTDHNVKSNLDSVAQLLGMRPCYTPVVGYEYTTPLGHFNVFPVPFNTPVPDPQIKSWDEVADNLQHTDQPKIIILNHGRDIHKGFRPFDPLYHISCAGISLRGWKFPPNAMEVINSSAALTDYMSLYHDWFGLMNRGYRLTPVGASDSHHVSRYLVGQGRTYIKAEDENPGNIDKEAALENLKQGKVMVSLGLLTELIVDSKYGPGELVPFSSSEMNVSIRVSAPAWTTADKITLYANGVKIKEEVISSCKKPGVKYSATWKIPRPRHDVFLVAIAEGPGSNHPFWQSPKPYQNTSPVWNARVIGSTGAVWVDGDRDEKWNCAYEYARQLVNSSDQNIKSLIAKLASYDEAVAIQAAAILQLNGQAINSPEMTSALEQATPATKAGFQRFIREYQLTSSQ